ncbi:MAG: hypothetical protein ACI84C_000606 [Flavobacteriales bacterium]|jgi:uncharacterized protein (DUF983 family)
MLAKGSKLYTILNSSCPRCQDAPLFKNGNPYGKAGLKMHDECEHCGESFKREPGFYFGAAYVSYGLTVALWVAVFVALMCFDWWGLISFSFYENSNTFFLTGLVALIVALPILYRLSRAIWISTFVKYEGSDAVKKVRLNRPQ